MGFQVLLGLLWQIWVSHATSFEMPPETACPQATDSDLGPWIFLGPAEERLLGSAATRVTEAANGFERPRLPKGRDNPFVNRWRREIARGCAPSWQRLVQPVGSSQARPAFAKFGCPFKAITRTAGGRHGHAQGQRRHFHDDRRNMLLQKD